jgi:tRNA(Ile)-lysidine synthetase-like protein
MGVFYFYRYLHVMESFDLSRIQQHLMINGVEQHSRIGIAISGGVDSVVLFHAVHLLGYAHLTLLHVNYGLRGEDSRLDAIFVEQLAVNKRVHVMIHDASIFMNNGKGNIQARAREIRYAWFHSLIHAQQLDVILLAHHQQDVVETILLQMTRKTGLSGMSAMGDRGYILRPLIDFKKRTLLDYARQNGWQWREDATNAQRKYRRNQIRHDVIPVLEQLGEHAIPNIVETAQQLSATQDLLESLIKHIQQQVVWQSNQTSCIVSLEPLFNLHPTALMLYYVLKNKGLSYTMADEIQSAYRHNRSGGIWSTPHWKFCLQGKALYGFSAEALEHQPSICLEDIWKNQYTSPFFFYQFSDQRHGHLMADMYHVLFPENVLSDIQIRNRIAGDSVKTPVGTRKLSDVMSEKSSPVLMRDFWPIVTYKHHIIFVPGIYQPYFFKDTSEKMQCLTIKSLFLPP